MSAGTCKSGCCLNGPTCLVSVLYCKPVIKITRQLAYLAFKVALYPGGLLYLLHYTHCSSVGMFMCVCVTSTTAAKCIV